jgi:hypothetical protein
VSYRWEADDAPPRSRPDPAEVERVLKMVESGKITAREAHDLLQAMEAV